MREKKEMKDVLPVFAGIGPWVPRSFDIDRINELKEGQFRALQSIPFLGIYLPPGWERVELHKEHGAKGVCMGDNQKYGAYFVDATGLGKPADPALMLQEFVQRIQPERGYAIVEKGKYQVKIGIFQKIESKKPAKFWSRISESNSLLKDCPFHEYRKLYQRNYIQ